MKALAGDFRDSGRKSGYVYGSRLGCDRSTVSKLSIRAVAPALDSTGNRYGTTVSGSERKPLGLFAEIDRHGDVRIRSSSVSKPAACAVSPTSDRSGDDGARMVLSKRDFGDSRRNARNVDRSVGIDVRAVSELSIRIESPTFGSSGCGYGATVVLVDTEGSGSRKTCQKGRSIDVDVRADPQLSIVVISPAIRSSRRGKGTSGRLSGIYVGDGRGNRNFGYCRKR